MMLRISTTGGSGLHRGQAEGSNIEMVWVCEEEVPDAAIRMCERLDIASTRRGRGMPRKYWGEMIRQDRMQP